MGRLAALRGFRRGKATPSVLSAEPQAVRVTPALRAARVALRARLAALGGVTVVTDSRIWPAWARSVGALAEAEAVVRFLCPACRKLYAVDLEAMILLRGRQWSLIDRRGKCKWVQCRRRGPFVAAPSYNALYIMLSTTERLPGWLVGSRPSDDEPKPPPPPSPPAPKGVDPVRWLTASESERKRMVRLARG